MNKESIIHILKTIGAKRIRPATRYVRASCLFARWSHSDGDDSNPSMSILVNNNDKSWCKCFACNLSAPFSDVLLEYNKRINFILTDLVWKASLNEQLLMNSLIGNKIKEKVKIDFQVYSESELSPFIGKIPRYVLNQNISLDTAKEFELGYDSANKRVIFPLRNLKGELTGIFGKHIHSADPKYIYYWSFRKEMYLYGENKLIPQNPHRFIVTEGILDMLSLYSRGYRNIVSVMGAIPSKLQVDKIRQLKMSTIYLLPDNDEGGLKFIELFKKYGADLPLRYVKSETKNPRKMTDTQLELSIRNSKDIK